MFSGDNAALYFVDRHVAEGRGEKPAYREAFGERRALSYAALSEQSARAASALARAGLRREERAAMLVLDTLEFPILFWGCLKAGVIPIPLNTLLATPVYDAMLRDSRAACLFVSRELLPVIAPVLVGNPWLRLVVVIDTNAENATSFSAFMTSAEPMPAVEASSDETAFWLYSSGSTGRPKGVRHVHQSLKATADSYGRNVLGIREDDIVYSAAKLFFAYGLGNGMTFPLSVGATTLLYNGRPTPDSTLSLLRDEQPTIFCGVPTLYAATLAQAEKAPPQTSSRLRLCISAGEALPEQIGRRWREMWDVDILDGVGSTEMLHIFLSNRTGDVVYGTSGIAVPGYELRLVDEDGTEVGPGNVGELLVKGPSASEGYWNQLEKSRATFEGEWTRTGDKYEKNAEGRLVYCGRTDDMFKVSGIWVSPFEVEQALIAHPAILEAAVIAATDEDGLEKPKAFIVLKEGGASDDLAAELKSFVQDRVGKWKYPRWIEVVSDLPKTATGKIQRFKLREGKS